MSESRWRGLSHSVSSRQWSRAGCFLEECLEVVSQTQGQPLDVALATVKGGAGSLIWAEARLSRGMGLLSQSAGLIPINLVSKQIARLVKFPFKMQTRFDRVN